ncbi:MAG TPA: DUF2231 domain-containing protein [Pyrinomonadaceae bacterium]|jgi:uncharacterized membrane protein|nr:DUF2231 domain-containing protein [Pyrinomonadaceae bacterium]
MPPLHPAFVHFPIALVVVSFLADLLGRIFNKASLRWTGLWSMVAALIFGAITAATGYWDWKRLGGVLGDTNRYVDFHFDVGLVLVGAVIVLTIWRVIYSRRDRQPGVPYLIAMLLATGLVLFQGWYGGQMVYSQGAGVSAASKGTEPADNGKKVLDKITPKGD